MWCCRVRRIGFEEAKEEKISLGVDALGRGVDIGPTRRTLKIAHTPPAPAPAPARPTALRCPAAVDWPTRDWKSWARLRAVTPSSRSSASLCGHALEKNLSQSSFSCRTSRFLLLFSRFRRTTQDFKPHENFAHHTAQRRQLGSTVCLVCESGDLF